MRDFIEENLREMVKINSESEGQMDDIVDFTTGLLDDIGLEYEVIDEDGFKPVIIASNGEGGVCFSGHLDTVPLGDGWEHEQGEIIGDKMYGRGTLDMKGPCLSIIAAAERLYKENVPFSIIFTTDEEVTMSGAKEVADRPEVTEASAVLVCEPTDMRVVNQEKGVYQFEITTEGKNAHASMPEKGENAIVKILPILTSLSRKNNIPAEKDEMSCCVNVIEGGEATNVIPDSCRAEVDVRFPDHFDKDLLKKYLFDPIDGDFDLKEIQYLDSVKLSKDRGSVQKLIEISKAETGYVPYGTEMVRYYQENKDTMIFGPGKVDSAHQPDEYIDLDQLVDIVDIYVDYAKSMVDID